MPDGMTFMTVPPASDDELIATCAAIVRLRQAARDLSHGADPGSRAERILNAHYLRFLRLEGAMVRRMCALRAHTSDGHRVRALTLGAWHPDDISMTWADDQHAMQILAALVRDLISD